MSDAKRALDAHAYVDGCLSAADRTIFEAAMARDSRLRARVEVWRSQNEAIQIAFGAATRPQAPAARPSNENKPHALTPPRISPARARVAAIALCTFLALAFWPSGNSSDPRAALAARAEAALRASAGAPLDFASADQHVVAAWLSAHLPGIGQVSLHPPGWTLQGVRLVPGLGETAALIIYEDALGERGGLLLERTDASPEWPTKVERSVDLVKVSGVARGIDYAAVGPRASGAAALAPHLHPPR